MSLDGKIIPLYAEHSGTIRISGRTSPVAAGTCAYQLLLSGLPVIDFFYIGGNAGQQATKAMGIFAYIVHNCRELTNMEVAFQPLLVKTVILNEGEKTGTVWRTFVFDRPKNMLKLNDTTDHIPQRD